MSYILACDIGGTHITSAIVNPTNWTILPNTITRAYLNSAADAKSIFYSWANNIKNCLNNFNGEVKYIGIAMPGPFDYERGISLMNNQDKYDALYKLNTSEGLSEALENFNIEIKYINDAAAFLQGEVYAQDLNNEEIVLGITLGTGLGSAVWIKGQKAFDADLWKASYKDSIFEEYLVTRWFTNRFEELTGIKEVGLKEIIDKQSTLPEFELLMKEYRAQLKDFLIYFSQTHNCKQFILGGNIAKAWDMINIDNYFSEFKLIKSVYEEKAALIGAASIF